MGIYASSRTRKCVRVCLGSTSGAGRRGLGHALSSMEELEATGNIARALGLVNIHLLDHFILTDTEYFSMRDANRLPIYDFKTGTLFWP